MLRTMTRTRNMSADKNKQFVGVRFHLYGKYDYNEELIFWVTNQMPLDEKAYEELIFPVLQSVTNVGVEQDEFYPKAVNGTLRINNTRDGLNFERRFTDLADLFVIQGAFVEIYTYCTNVKMQEFVDESNILWSGEIQSVQYGSRNERDGQRLTIGLGRTEPSHPVTKQLRVSEFIELPDRSKNKILPLVLGTQQQVIPYAIEEQVRQEPPIVVPIGATQRFAYATNLEGSGANRFHNQGIDRYLIANPDKENQDSEYKEVFSADNPFIADYFPPVPVGPPAATITNLSTPQAFWVANYFPGIVPTTPRVVTTVAIELEGNGNGGDAEGELSIRLHRQRPNFLRPTPVSDVLAEVVIDKSEFSSDWTGSGTFTVGGVFNRIVPLVDEGIYFLSVQGSNEDDPSSVTILNIYDIAFQIGVPVGLVTHFKGTDTAGSENDETWVEELSFAVGGQSSANYGLLCLEFEDDPAPGGFDAEGLGYSQLTLRYNDAAAFFPNEGGQIIEDIDRIDLILEITGLTDTDGAVTGVPGFILGNPLSQIEALYSTFDGSGWVLGNFNNTRFTDSHTQYVDVNAEFFRDTSGRTFNRTTNIDIIKQLARNSYSVVTYDGINGAAEYALYAPGRRRAPVAHFTDSNAVIERWNVNNLSQVVNAINMNYARRLDNVHFQHERDTEQFDDYSQTQLFHYRDGGIGQNLSELSHLHYGERRMNDEDFDWILTNTSAGHVGELILSLHEHPYEYALANVSYCEFDFLQMLDIVKISSTELPHIYGTNPLVCSVNTANSCWFTGMPWSQSGSYEAEIVAMVFNYRPTGDTRLRLLLRLINFVNDPQARISPPSGVF